MTIRRHQIVLSHILKPISISILLDLVIKLCLIYAPSQQSQEVSGYLTKNASKSALSPVVAHATLHSDSQLFADKLIYLDDYKIGEDPLWL